MEVRFSKTAAKALLRSGKAKLIREKIAALAADPESQSANVKRLKDRPESRLRVQDWRVIFRIEDDVLWIDDVSSRGEAYRR